MCRTSTNVQEVCRLTSIELDCIHSCHCQPGSISQYSNVSLQVNVLQVKAVCDALFIVHLSPILLSFKLCLPVQSVVIYYNLGTGSHDLFVCCVN